MNLGTKVTALALVGLFGALAAMPATAVVETEADAEFVVVNQTSSWLRIYMDGSLVLSVPPGDRSVTLVTPGTYNLKAVTPDGRTATRRQTITEQGGSWTITEG